MSQSKHRLPNVDILKGLAITLVVIGNLPSPDAAYPLWAMLKRFIYSFNMPLFMMISGFLYAEAAPKGGWPEYLQLLRKKVDRLIIPYFAISAVVLVITFFIQKLGARLQFPVTPDFWKFILFNPMGGFSTFLWFVYTLTVIFVIYPLLERYVKNQIILTLLCLAIGFLSAPRYFCLNLAVKFLICFHLGVVWQKGTVPCGSRGQSPSPQEKPIVWLGVAFAFCLFFFGIDLNMASFDPLIKILIAVLASVGFWYLSVVLESKGQVARGLETFGIYCVPIYLLNSLVMLPSQFVPPEIMARNFLVFVPVAILAIAAGLVVPVLFTKHVLSRSGILTRIFLGVKEV